MNASLLTQMLQSPQCFVVPGGRGVSVAMREVGKMREGIVWWLAFKCVRIDPRLQTMNYGDMYCATVHLPWTT